MAKQQKPKTDAELYMARERDPKAYWTSQPGLLRVAGWALDGLTVEQIAEQMNITKRRLIQWQSRDLALKEALANNRDAADREVENSLRRQALGYTYTETKSTIEVYPDGTKSKKVEKFERYAKPESAATIFYLKNRKSDVWRDLQQLDLAATVGLVQIVDDIPTSKIIEGEVVDGTARITDGSDRT